MALMPCPDCEQPISEHAVACPKCGCPVVQIATADLNSDDEVIQDEPALEYEVAKPIEVGMGLVWRKPLLVTPDRIQYGAREIAFQQATAVRWGTLVEKMQIGFQSPRPIANHYSIWIRSASQHIRLECVRAKLVSDASESTRVLNGAQVYEAVVARLWHWCAADMIRRCLVDIFSGNTVRVAGVDLTSEGAWLRHPLPVGIGLSKKLVGWHDLRAGVYAGELNVSGARRYTTVTVRSTDNAPILYGIIEWISQMKDWCRERGGGDLGAGILREVKECRDDEDSWRAMLDLIRPMW